MSKALTFNQRPTAVNQLNKRLENIERLHTQKNETTIAKQHDRLLTVQQAAEFLGLAVSTIYSLVYRRKLSAIKCSNRLYFSQQQLTKYLKVRRKKTMVNRAKGFLRWYKYNTSFIKSAIDLLKVIFTWLL